MPDITMPQLGETVTEGTITKWFKTVGDQVSEDEPLFEVSTDKVDSEVPAAASGYLAEILVQEGETVDVGTKLAVIGQEAPSGASSGASSGESEAASGDAQGFESMEETAGAESGDHEGRPPGAEAEAEQAGAAPAPPPKQEPDGPSPTGGGNGASDEARDSAPSNEVPSPTAAGSVRTGPRRVLSPVVRRLLAEHDLDPSQIRGTGQQGRITRSDVLAHLEHAPATRQAEPPAAAAPAGARPAPPAVPAEPAPAAVAAAGDGAAARGQDAEVIPFSNIRRRTAEHMVRSKATSAHVLVAIEVDFENVDRVRDAMKATFKQDEGFSLTYLPFISRAVVDAIAEFPHVNASVGENQLVVHRHVHLGFAVDLSFEGLIVPVVHNADDKRLRTIARELADLAARARARKLTADEISGSTFTITNPGGYGTLLTAPVINQPQVAILSTDAVKKRPVVVELADGTDAIAVHRVGNLAMSFDHRAFDGAYAAAFLARTKEILESRDWSQEL